MALEIPVPGPIAGAAGAAGAAATGAAGVIAGIAGTVGGKVVQSLPGASQVGDAVATLQAARAWISDRHNWTRVAWFAGGSVMFTVGALMLGERPIANATTAVVKPVGRVVKSAYKG